MSKKLYVGNLPYSSSEGELTEMFGKIGAVESVSIVTDKFSGKSRGFGFVVMASDDDAAKAINEMNGQTIGGRRLIVSEARSTGEKKGGGGPRNFRGRRREGGGYSDEPGDSGSNE
jgi:cold-inducible RNA-binding protein